MKLLHEVCSLPTAPFAEEHVIAYIERFVAARPNLKLSRDRSSNLLIELPSRNKRKKLPRWIFAAHMDHPGMVATRMRDPRTLEARFHGGVRTEYVRGAKVRFFSGGEEITGVVTEAIAGERERAMMPSRVVVRVKSAVEAGSPGMFDQGEARKRGKRFLSRAIDDLGGLAAALAMIDQLLRKPPDSPVAVMLTRAEEEGFIGAIAAAKRPRLLRRSDRIIAIECSAMQPYAPQGAGTIIRVGDKTSIFNSALTYFLTTEAEALARKDKTFKYQRALMPGGTCEATVYDVYGFIAASVCVPLGNYHNMDRAKKKIAPEFIDVSDWKNMVKLFVRLAKQGHEFDGSNRALRARVEKRFRRLAPLLAQATQAGS
jgi:endoglucanase